MTGFMRSILLALAARRPAAPDEWTRDRIDRMVALSRTGSAEAARLAYRETVGQEFAHYLLASGRIGRGDEVRT